MRKSTRFALLVSVTLIALGLLFVGRPLVGTDQAEAAAPLPGSGASRVLPMLQFDGGAKPASGTAGGIAKVTHDAMCYSRTGCVEVGTAAVGAVTGYSTVVSGRWYEMTVTGDLAQGIAGCWDETGAISTVIHCGANDAGCISDSGVSCFGKPKLKDGTVKPIAFPATTYCQSDAGCYPTPYDDAGGITCQADVGCVRETHLYFYAVQATGFSVTFCPQVPCQ